MKFVLLASMAAMAAAQVDLDDASTDIKTRFEAYIEQFNKSYSETEIVRRFNVFKNNDDIIQQHNSQDLGFTLGHNEFSDMTLDEFTDAYIGNGLENPVLRRAKNYNTDLLKADVKSAAPDSIDWVANGAVTPVKNQGQCGSCWAFSTVMSVEGDFFIDTGSLVSFSEQDLVSCDTGGVNQGCNGGLMDDAFQWIEKNGICTESDYPYSSGSGTTGQCQRSCTPYATITGYTDVPQNDEDALKAAVAQQPVSVAIEADKSVFQLYKSGVLTSSQCGTNLDHGVGIVGYGNLDGTDYWKVKNSWGASWGMDGYILIQRGTDECGISQSASYPTGAKKL